MIKELISKIKKLLRKIKKFKIENKEFIDSNFEKQSYNYDNKPIGDVRLLFKDFKRRGLKINFILDVGAHLTNWIRIAMEIYPECTAYLIEPLVEMEENLKKFCRDYPGSKYFLNGAGSKEEILYLTTKGSLEGANFLLEKNKYLISNDFQREVKIITVDSLLEENKINIPDLVKLDVQGFELEVLKGAEKLFGKTEIFILEVSFYEYVKGTPIFSVVISFMADRGYEVYDFPGFLRRPYDGALGQIDVCFAKRDGFLRSSNAWFKIV